MQRRKRYLYATDAVPSRTKRWRANQSFKLSEIHSRNQETIAEPGASGVESPISDLVGVARPSGVDPAWIAAAQAFTQCKEVSHQCQDTSEETNLIRNDSGISPSCSEDSSTSQSCSDAESNSSEGAGEGSMEPSAGSSVEPASTLCPELQNENEPQDWIAPTDHEEYLNIPLCAATETSKGDAFLMCLALGLRHNLSWKAIEDVLKMINCLFGEEVIKSTKYFFHKYMDSGKGKLTYHLYCPYCERYIGVRETVTAVECPCGKSMKDIHEAKSYFLSLGLREQLKDLLNEEIFVDALQYRFDRVKEKAVGYEDIYDGEVYRRWSSPGQVLSYWQNMSFMFNTDGFPVGGKSGKQTCWPIYVQINELPPKLRSKFMLLAGIYVGKKDPNMKLFMHPFVEEANHLASSGLDWEYKGKQINSKIITLFACVDTPARCKILNHTFFNGHYGCPLCFNNPECTRVGKRYTLPMNAMDERTHDEIIVDAAQAHANRTLIRNKKYRRVRGVKGPCPMHNLLYFDLVMGARPDTMHSLLLSNGRQHAFILHDGVGKDYYVGSEVRMMTISKRLTSIRPPSSLFRTPREFSTFHTWKAREWLVWILCFAIPCLSGVIPEKYVSHLNLLSTCIHIVLSKSISEEELERAHLLALRYVFLCQQYFGKDIMVINIHLLMHLKRSIQCVDPAWTNMALGFEGSNKYLGELKKGTSSIVQEIACKYMTFRSLPLLCEKYGYTDQAIQFCQEMSERPLVKSFNRIGSVLLLGKGKQVLLDSEEHQCLLRFKGGHSCTVVTNEKFIMGSIRYTISSYSRSSKTDDSYISVRNESFCRIQRIVSITEGDDQSVALLVRELIIDPGPLFDDEYAKHSFLRKVTGEGQLLAIRPQDISGQCVAMFLESGNFICPVPYGCYGDS